MSPGTGDHSLCRRSLHGWPPCRSRYGSVPGSSGDDSPDWVSSAGYHGRTSVAAEGSGRELRPVRRRRSAAIRSHDRKGRSASPGGIRPRSAQAHVSLREASDPGCSRAICSEGGRCRRAAQALGRAREARVVLTKRRLSSRERASRLPASCGTKAYRPVPRRASGFPRCRHRFPWPPPTGRARTGSRDAPR